MSLFSAHAESKTTLNLKSTFTSPKAAVCLGDLVRPEGVAGREMEKLNSYCRIELKGERTVLTPKEVELHAWAAGVIPEKISGGQITVIRGPIAIGDVLNHAAVTDSVKASDRLRRGSTVKLIVKSANMQIAREAVILADAFPGETIDVRIAGTRKNLRARLVNSEAAELVQ